ncbi:hypothetical protein HRUBRA_02598 [Pseudohaliea rubra DSM 19751]|uniref:Uncharacterized protein n=1 Tax=Pseudohaliea rubra DSM 19751 TaxID=1265313 RepID=A0A095VMW1_9GAMM|nr:hypothetical protein HRUBRA_02598 [Pseudohaliea rubra DSM 19751]
MRQVARHAASLGDLVADAAGMALVLGLAALLPRGGRGATP